MQEDNSLSALTSPGDSASAFFNFESAPPAFNPLITNVYSRTNAMWLMELCRLVYRNDGIQPSRGDFLKGQGFNEVKFFNRERTQGSLVAAANFAVLAFQRTLGLGDWLSDFEGFPTNWAGEGKVHKGFKDQFDAVWSEVTTELDKLMVPIFYTGHSLGAASPGYLDAYKTAAGTIVATVGSALIFGCYLMMRRLGRVPEPRRTRTPR